MAVSLYHSQFITIGNFTGDPPDKLCLRSELYFGLRYIRPHHSLNLIFKYCKRLTDKIIHLSYLEN